MSKTSASFGIGENMSGHQGPQSLEEQGVRAELTYNLLDGLSIMNTVRSPQAGAIVLFAGMLSPTVVSP